jgi:DNA-binding response OmpR family regulator
MSAVKALLISPDPRLRQILRVSLGALEREVGEPWRYLEAADGLEGIRVAWRERPDVVVADEIASRAGAFAVVKDLKGAIEPFPGVVVVVLARREDEWLAKWSGADAWFVKPIDPFALTDAVVSLLERRGTAGADEPEGATT